jgi:competence protein ComEA
MSWRTGSHRARDEVERRLLRFGDRWRPPDVEEVAEQDAWAQAPRRLSIGPWSGPALRGLLLLVLLVSVVVGYLFWQARPREVVAAPVASSVAVPEGVEVPQILATGVPLTGAAGSVPRSDPAGGVEPVQSAESVEPVDVVVHVAGLVKHPGLVRLPAGSRIADAIEEAGGVTRRRAADSVNLARVLVDGEQIMVSDAPSSALVSPTGSSASAGGGPGTVTVIDLNTATVEMLDALPGVGPVLAGRILAWRTTHGRFRSIDELGEVSGIGDAILTQLRPLVRV